MKSLLVLAAGRICALPLASIDETMRELDCVPSAGTPSWVRGASMIHGSAVPVVDLAALLGGVRSVEAGRMVTVRTRPSTIAILVDDVVGMRTVTSDTERTRSSLLDGADRRCADELATLDANLLSFLDLSEIVSEELSACAANGAHP